MKINIAAFKKQVKTLGPGNRIAVWVQGCNKSCPGCISKEWQSKEPNVLIDVRKLFAIIYKCNEDNKLEGITISGGEPFIQPEPLYYLCKWLKEYTSLGIIVFTGYKYDDLVKRDQSIINKLLNNIDLLIAGPFKKELNDNKGLRGSSNQTFNYLTEKYLKYKEEIESGVREVEITFNEKESFLIGVPGEDTLKSFYEIHSENKGR